MATQPFHAAIDEDTFGSGTTAEYRGYLTRVYSFLFPVERSIQSTPNIASYVDVRRFHKHELLRRDLAALRMKSEQIGAIALCSVPWFDTPEEALGWAYLIERNTLRHTEMFRRLASTNPGDAAFATSYLKCYYGTAGEMWRIFSRALEVFEGTKQRRDRLIDAAKAAFRCCDSWRLLRDGPAEPAGSNPVIRVVDDDE